MHKLTRNLVFSALPLLAVPAISQTATLQTPPPLSATVEYLASEIPENSYLRPNLFFTLPGKINGFSFVELYKSDKDGNSKGYYGETNLNRTIGNSMFTIDSKTLHGNEPFTKTSLGAGINILMPENCYASIKVLPAWFDKK